MRLDDLAVLVLQQVGAVAVQHARRAGAQRRGVLAGRDARRRAASTPIRRTAVVRDVRMEDAHRVRAAADAGDHRVGLAAGQLRHLHDGTRSPITDWKSRTIIGYGCGPATVPMM